MKLTIKAAVLAKQDESASGREAQESHKRQMYYDYCVGYRCWQACSPLEHIAAKCDFEEYKQLFTRAVFTQESDAIKYCQENIDDVETDYLAGRKTFMIWTKEDLARHINGAIAPRVEPRENGSGAGFESRLVSPKSIKKGGEPQ